MPAVHLESFRVRYCECDPDGLLQTVPCLRWMQEAAFAASTAVGYDFARYRETGHLWLVRETELESFRPVRYGDEIQVKTWVMDFRRFHSRRAYEFRTVPGGELAVRASTDWIYLNARSQRPASVPESIQRAFLPEGTTVSSAPRARWPMLPPPTEAVSIHRPVEWRDLDLLGHVNNAVYLEYLEDAAAEASAARGWSRRRLRDQGLSVMTRALRIEYRQAAALGDELEVTAWPVDGPGDGLQRQFMIRRMPSGDAVAHASLLQTWIEARTARPVPVAPELLPTRETSAPPGGSP